MISVIRSLLILALCLAGSAACSLVSPAPSQPTETSRPTISPVTPPTTRPLPTTALPPAPAPSDTPPAPAATDFPEEQLHTVGHDAGSITAVVPSVWTDVRSSDWRNEQGAVIGHVLLASADVEAFLRWEVEGVSISVSRKFGSGYIQLLDADYAKFGEICDDPFKTYWDWSSRLHRGKYFVLDECAGVADSWLSVLSVVSSGDTGDYVAEVLAYDMVPIFGDTFRDIVMRFEVFPEQLP